MAHQNLNFGFAGNAVTPSPLSQIVVQYKNNWGDAWTTLENVRFDTATWGCAPSMPRAQMTQRYGLGKQPGDTVFSTYGSTDFERDYLRIAFSYRSNPVGPVWTPAWFWYGQVEIVGDLYEGSVGDTIEMGEQQVVALGLYNLLDQHRITQSQFRNAGGTTKTADGGFVFNEAGKGNRTATKPVTPGTHHMFEWDPDPDSTTWSTRDIVEYLVKSGHGVPADEAGNADVPFDIDTADLDMLPTWDAPEIETHYVSVTQILNALISRRRLLTWWLEVEEESPPQTVKLRVKTFTDSAISLPSGASIPANPDTISLNLQADQTAAVVHQIDTTHRVDQVVAYGALRTSTFTATFGVSSSHIFRAGWDSTQETAYEAGGSGDGGYPASTEVTDRRKWLARVRAKEEVKPVYRRWTLRESTVVYPPNDPDGYEMFFGNVRLLPRIPMLEGVDYSGNTIDSGSYVYTGTGELVDRPPLIVIQIPGTSPAEFVKLDEIGRGAPYEVTDEADVRDWSANIRVPKDGKTLLIDVIGAPQHTIAFTDFSGQAEDEQEHGEWDWDTMQCTATIQDERYVEGRWPDDASIATTDAVRRIRIPAGANYRQDFVDTGVVVDVDDDGTLLTTTNDGFINDDTDTLEDIAKQAFQWYGRTRSAVRVRASWETEWDLVQLGQYVTTIAHRVAGDTMVEALVTQLTVQAYHRVGQEVASSGLPPLKVTLSTAFGELDYVRLGLRHERGHRALITQVAARG